MFWAELSAVYMWQNTRYTLPSHWLCSNLPTIKSQKDDGKLGFYPSILWHYAQVWHSCQLHSSASFYLQGNSLVLISVSGWVQSSGTERWQKEYVIWNFLRALQVIEPETSRVWCSASNNHSVRPSLPTPTQKKKAWCILWLILGIS
jgi:hypothetical protein